MLPLLLPPQWQTLPLPLALPLALPVALPVALPPPLPPPPPPQSLSCRGQRISSRRRFSSSPSPMCVHADEKRNGNERDASKDVVIQEELGVESHKSSTATRLEGEGSSSHCVAASQLYDMLAERKSNEILGRSKGNLSTVVFQSAARVAQECRSLDTYGVKKTDFFVACIDDWAERRRGFAIFDTGFSLPTRPRIFLREVLKDIN